MRDRERLLDPAWRAEVAGAEDLFNALSSAIGHNLVRADLDYSVKGDRWMVLYLNRLLCVRFGLALGYGGLRERPVEELCSWMSSEPPAEEPLVAPPLKSELPIDARWGSPCSARGAEEVRALWAEREVGSTLMIVGARI